MAGVAAKFKRVASNNDQEFDGYRSTSREKAANATAVIATKGFLHRVEVQLKSDAAADYWLHVFDKATTPGAGDIGIVPPVKVTKGSNAARDLLPDGIEFTLGLWVMLSTTEDGYTAPGDDKGIFSIQYVKKA